MIKTREELRKLREIYAASLGEEDKKILICAGTGCISSGSLEIYDELKKIMEERGINVAVELREEPHEHSVGLKKSGCHGFCEMGPLVRIEPQGWLYVKVKPEDCSEIIEKTIVGGEHIARLAYAKNGEIYKKQGEIPFYKKQTRHVLEHCGHIDATSIKEYLAIGGYSAFERALFDMNGDEIVGMIEESNLRGRGGGGFPTGRKWSQVKRQNAEHKYIVCNGDEGDPGAFMDRSIMEGDPHRMLEGMMIAGLACGAQNGYIYVRAEYPMAVSRLRTAIAQAEELGLLGGDILGSGFSFRMHINRGAGAFVCGEGSALTASIEGKRGMPRVKPPRTVEHGLFDSPTVLNNVETFANVPLIINKGVAWYKTLGPEKSPGTKAFALTGNIENTGLIEVPMGTTLREIVFEVGGGMRGGADFKAVQIGGPSGGCLTVKDLDLPLDFDSLKAAGAMIGSGGLVVMDSRTCMVEVARFFMNFTQNESCGKCVPCRGGTKQMLAILERIVAGEGREGDIDLLLELADMISHTALCGLGKTAALPVVSTIKNFREEYEAHISKKYCPVGACAKLKSFEIDPALCKGCSKCARGCPVEAICGKIKEPFTIDKEKCIKCGACVTACPFHAVKEV
ncbi:NADH-ubiquinone oxidoreductase-F iron-sulfur binding region domain-containing protein [Cloacibacillus evryensis]|uniref:4Fe-4S binding protein n=2 Tax=Cloacibacillus evryensis TaxID=508460 RepID=A0AAW5JY80_9BACT|nr:NADH-ubiquinone oxidoreductase-F iron-sulfur binding region domain-containing protein [Cloacibacillus evryensis]EXG78935.1 NADH:ubiquinone oxidoreductase, NADH-binding (51 kD) subunit [Cloacibacillus evryensis DSM 19522]MCQ4763356.1 4Fe-4S binding protein [Cloacibacillus evryensis]MCQ4813525.1 4Fe-4S binding protein [Cloacibacillus evryensis]MEA5036194.1 NADH-ubiquinone oxidoreductase-F iron-sulfur binding region domain-containing protein [Cloacibacillus evryensis]